LLLLKILTSLLWKLKDPPLSQKFSKAEKCKELYVHNFCFSPDNYSSINALHSFIYHPELVQAQQWQQYHGSLTPPGWEGARNGGKQYSIHILYVKFYKHFMQADTVTK
jgi:hypothetical protein